MSRGKKGPFSIVEECLKMVCFCVCGHFIPCPEQHQGNHRFQNNKKVRIHKEKESEEIAKEALVS